MHKNTEGNERIRHRIDAYSQGGFIQSLLWRSIGRAIAQPTAVLIGSLSLFAFSFLSLSLSLSLSLYLFLFSFFLFLKFELSGHQCTACATFRLAIAIQLGRAQAGNSVTMF